MKNDFHGYYPPTTEQYERLWKEGIIVLDTNVLLSLYRLPATARDELVSVLKLIKNRLWIPYHVALEFQSNRLTVIASERKVTQDALERTKNNINDIIKNIDALQLDKRGLGIESQSLIDQLNLSNDKIIDAIQAAHNSQLDISSIDPVRETLDSLLENNVGDGPATQSDLDALVADGDERYKEKIPPGFKDDEKNKNPTLATFIFDNIKYQRRFGDLIIWRQMIRHVREKNEKSVLLVTADQKADWWWEEHGRILGPHTELVREIRREAGVDLFWMYSSAQFVEHANKYISATVSSESVAEIKHATLLNVRDYLSIYAEPSRSTLSFLDVPEALNDERFITDQTGYIDINMKVKAWLESRAGYVEENHRGFPDFLIRDGDYVHGYEVKYVRQFDRMLFSPSIINSLLRGYLETREGRLSSFTQIVVIPESDFYDAINSNRISELSRRLRNLIIKYPVNSIIIGSVVKGSFEVLDKCQKSADNIELL